MKQVLDLLAQWQRITWTLNLPSCERPHGAGNSRWGDPGSSSSPGEVTLLILLPSVYRSGMEAMVLIMCEVKRRRRERAVWCRWFVFQPRAVCARLFVLETGVEE
jgi:hypothetical protein